ncbi:MAG: hypothetical protein E7616_08830 [Ruminococcaceae bacterium]|nr:hypothetical protein [Oscillospiraceae bacterium]
MKKRSIKSLLSKKKAVYVKLSTEPVAEAFFALAKYEGFTLTDPVAKTGIHRNCIVRLNDDMTVSYPSYHSWMGAMRFHHAKTENGKKVVKIDFEKML